ncbi:hypothetical protein [Methyloceanibacter caenitepidi]|uniref:Uncharacterized protein n=1 Tax=Methyloceanibacter caenitepidi TaxID=1384459 RepID=A0A0A8K5Q6_9HYPH|nr:hypothetical protein [Methyloceanibacter caenitepidi]BAQ18245.1 hypothetical protein GL4_2811 [Methyloceanibacter caenitepidi]
MGICEQAKPALGDAKRFPIQDATGITMGAVKDRSAKVDRLTEAVGIW